MLVVPTNIIHDQPLAMMEQENPTEHVCLALVAYEFWMTARITDCNPKMVIFEAAIVRHSWLRAGEYKDTGLTVPANLILRECGPALRPI